MSTAGSLHQGTSVPTTRGVVYIHSASTALCPHVGWALEGVLGRAVSLDWRPQPLGAGLLRSEFSWVGPQGLGAALASALRGFDTVRYEITEDPSEGVDGARWSHTPSLGLHHTMTSASGDAVVHEDRLRHAVDAAGGDPRALAENLDVVLGTAWDAELEPFRHAGEDAPVRWLHKVG